MATNRNAGMNNDRNAGMNNDRNAGMNNDRNAGMNNDRNAGMNNDRSADMSNDRSAGMNNDNAAEALLKLQDTDIKLLQLKKQFDELPHRVRILELRAKQREVEGKTEQLNSLQAEQEHTLQLLQNEEERAIAHSKDVQNRIGESFDYKKTTALTHELQCAIEHTEKLESDSLKQMEKLDKAAEVASQLSAALTRLKQQETEVIEDFKKQGGALQNAIARETGLRKTLATRLPAPMLTRYERAVVAKGGIGAAWIEDDHCSACRLPYSEGQVAKFRSIGAIAECPHCHRLLVTKRQQ